MNGIRHFLSDHYYLIFRITNAILLYIYLINVDIHFLCIRARIHHIYIYIRLFVRMFKYDNNKYEYLITFKNLFLICLWVEHALRNKQRFKNPWVPKVLTKPPNKIKRNCRRFKCNDFIPHVDITRVHKKRLNYSYFIRLDLLHIKYG